MLKNLHQTFLAIPRSVKIAILGVMLIYSAVSGAASLATPWWVGKGDSALHIDYVLSVYNREIPKYHDFVKYQVFHELDAGYKTQIQRAAANPPLFYAIHAPIVGPLLKSQHWKQAIATGRAINILIGLLTILALAWAGWLYGGRRKEIFAVTVPAIGSLFYEFVILNQNYAVDVLLALLTTLTFVVWYKLIYEGLTKATTALLIIVSMLGMATKATYVVFLALSLMTIFIAIFIHTKSSKFKKIMNGSALSALVLTAVLITSGWFYYYWNYKISGRWYSAMLPGDLHRRPYKSLSTVLLHQDLWSNFYNKTTGSSPVSILITIVSGAGLLIKLSKLKLSQLLKNQQLLILASLLILATIGTTITQITHAVGIGHINFRYFLPVLFVFSLVISYGLLEFKRLSAWLVNLTVLAMAGSSLIAMVTQPYIRDVVPGIQSVPTISGKFNLALKYNGLSSAVFIGLIICLAIGYFLFAKSVFTILRRRSI